MAVNLNKHDLGAVSFGMASVILAYAGRKEIKKAFVYGVKGLYKASKRTLSFAKKPLTNFRPSRRNMLRKTVQIRSETLCSTKLTNLWGIQDSHVKLYQGRMFLIAEGGSNGNELYIFMEAKKNHPEVPKIIYDGRDHAIFLRNARQKIILDYIHPEIRDKLRKAFQVMVVETILDNIKETYPVEMEIVDNIPLDWNKAGLGTWEEVFLSESNHA